MSAVSPTNNLIRRPKIMAAKRATISELRERISDLEAENEELAATLDDVYSIVAPEPEEDDDDTDDSDDDE